MVVVVVVCAMVDRELIGEVDHILRYHEKSYNSQNIQNQIRYRNLGYDAGDSLYVMIKDSSSQELIDDFRTDVYSDGSGFTIPSDIIDSNQLNPGQKITLKVYDAVDKKPDDNNTGGFVDDAAVIDRTSTVMDKTNSDNVDSRMFSPAVYEQLGDESAVLEYTNTKNQKTAKAEVETIEEANAFQFPYDVRRKIDAGPDDTIEIRILSETRRGDISDSEQFEEMYEMLSDIHSWLSEYRND